MRRAIVLTGVVVLALAARAEAATLNKCIDLQGKVTYSNLPCRNAKEVRRVELDPDPQPDPVRAAAVRAETAQPAKPAEPAAPKPAPTPTESAPIHLESRRTAEKPAARASASKCDTLSDKLGRVLDKMDQAHRKGHTQDQMDKWNLEVKELERKKQQSGCF